MKNPTLVTRDLALPWFLTVTLKTMLSPRDGSAGVHSRGSVIGHGEIGPTIPVQIRHRDHARELATGKGLCRQKVALAERLPSAALDASAR